MTRRSRPARPLRRAALRPVTDSYHGKSELITRRLREALVRGDYRPGDRLPTRVELARRFGVSNVTVQRALDQLTRDGFVVAHVRHGTFVADSPPHLMHYALLFPTRFESPPRNLFWTTLSHCARTASSDNMRFSVYPGFSGRDGFTGYDRLLGDLEASRIAGLIFANSPYQLEGTPLLTMPGVPRTGFMSRPGADMPAVSMDGDSLLRRAAARLRQHGRRRVAVVLAAQRLPSYAERAIAALAEQGIECPPHWVLAAPLDTPQWATPLVQLLASLPKRSRPDGLILTDQNHVAPAVQGLRDVGCDLGRDLSVIAHCNFPLLEGAELPVTWLGYDIAAGLQQCMDNINDMRAGRTPPPLTQLQARFMDDAE